MTNKIYFGEDDDIIDICYDNVFKAVFTRANHRSQTALSRLVSALIGREVAIISILANEPPIDNIRDKQIRYDINCRTEAGEFVNVEMSLNPEQFELLRLEFYASKLFSGQDIKGIKKTYKDLTQTYQIAILVKEKFFKDDKFFHSFEYYDPDNNVSLGGNSKIITLELAKLESVVEKPVEKMNIREFWAIFFRYLTDKKKRDKINEIVKQEEGIAFASEVLMEISKDEHEKARLLSELKYELDTQSRMVYATQQGQQRGQQIIIDLLKSGKSPDEIIREYDN